MKDKLIKTIREVPIADKTYLEYVEALANNMMSFCVEQASFDQMSIYILDHYAKQKARDIFEEIEKLLKKNELRNYEPCNVESYYSSDLEKDLAELKKKYTEAGANG